MSLYQCEHCGCCENTALGHYWWASDEDRFRFDWTGIEDRQGKRLCSACGPARFSDGSDTGNGEWHGSFKRVFLPLGKFKTNKLGNLEHVDTGSEDFHAYALDDLQAAEEQKSC